VEINLTEKPIFHSVVYILIIALCGRGEVFYPPHIDYKEVKWKSI